MNSLLLDPSLKGLEIGSSAWFAAQRKMVDAKPLIKQCLRPLFQTAADDVTV